MVAWLGCAHACLDAPPVVPPGGAGLPTSAQLSAPPSPLHPTTHHVPHDSLVFAVLSCFLSACCFPLRKAV